GGAASLVGGVGGVGGPFGGGGGDPGGGMLALWGGLVLRLPEFVGLGGEEEVGRLVVSGDETDHRLGPADEVTLLADVDWAFRVRDRDPVGESSLELQQVLDAEDLVDHARAIPEDHLAPSDFLEVLAEMSVGDKEDL